jgi:hypothetical protein
MFAMAQGRRALVTKILELSKDVAPALLKIDEGKEALREEIAETGEGFTETIEGLGTVEGKVGCEREVTGFEYVLNQDAFAKLPESRRKKLIEDQELVQLRQVVRSARKPSVTVRL